jgi:endonuclease YncB( thermonuclease family)
MQQVTGMNWTAGSGSPPSSCGWTPAASAPPDGDTIRVRMAGAEVPVRYILINTPESDEAFGAEATAVNRRLVEGQTVYLLKDVSETDRFNRLLRYVFLADGTHVNAALVRQGYAQVATFPPDVSREAEMRAAEAEARAAGRGLWAAGESAAPSAPQRSGEGVVVPAATPAPTPSGWGRLPMARLHLHREPIAATRPGL